MRWIGALGLAAAVVLGPAAQAQAICGDEAAARAAIEQSRGRWIPLTRDQWQFTRGIYAVNPATPAGLPVGDGAALAKIEGAPGGLIFFLDGKIACAPMPVPQEVLDLLSDVAADHIHHVDKGL